MIVGNYKTKNDLKKAIGKKLEFTETYTFDTEYMSTGSFEVIGPTKENQKWTATVTLENDIIKEVK